MAQKSYSKHSEYRTYSTQGNIEDKDFGLVKSELLPSKYGSLVQTSNGVPAKNKEYYYEYSEEKSPSGGYDRKDLHTVEQYEYTSNPGDNYYSYSGSKNPAIQSKTTVTKHDLSQNIEQLDSLLDDLQRDQERKLQRSGYTSDTMESSSFDYRTTLPKSSEIEWTPSTHSREMNKEIVRSQVIESRVPPPPPIVCTTCQRHNTQVSNTPMNKVTTTVKTYTYEVPADQDPSTVPIQNTSNSTAAFSEKYLTTNHNYTHENQEHANYVNTRFDTSTPIRKPPSSPQLGAGCQYCSHCNSQVTKTSTSVTELVPSDYIPPNTDSSKYTTKTTHYTTSSVYPDDLPNRNLSPSNNVYKYTTTNYTTYNVTDGPGTGKPGPFPAVPQPQKSSSPFPRTGSPPQRIQETPKKLDELLADFPVHENHVTDDGIRYRPNPARGPGGSIDENVVKETIRSQQANKKNEVVVATPTKNIEGPAVYYPPGHEMFSQKSEGAAYQQAGGGYMKAKGKYKYEAESSSKSKSSSGVTAVPVCLPLCCAMPCVIL